MSSRAKQRGTLTVPATDGTIQIFKINEGNEQNEREKNVGVASS
jgi:hypothetical protein